MGRGARRPAPHEGGRVNVANLPDDLVAYIPGLGEMTVREIRGERTPRDVEAEEEEATLKYWEARATANLCRGPRRKVGA